MDIRLGSTPNSGSTAMERVQRNVWGHQVPGTRHHAIEEELAHRQDSGIRWGDDIACVEIGENHGSPLSIVGSSGMRKAIQVNGPGVGTEVVPTGK
ncbi:hypothetical protein N7490_011505 [Penicillium lividum]|nr:hypothetical protein N7490_011505 [Penicillium lividum]